MRITVHITKQSKTLFLTITALAAALLFAAAALATTLPDPAKGFNDLKWGQDITGMDGFKKYRSKGNAAFYVRADDPFTIYNTKMPRVIYGTIGGKLFAAYVILDDSFIYKKLEGDLTRLYGAPVSKSNANADVMQWQSGDIKIKLKFEKNNKQFKLGYYYLPLSKNVKMANMEAVMDAIYNNELENFWINGSPLLEQKD